MLFLGSFLQIVLLCKARNVTQKKLVAVIMKSLSDLYGEDDDTTSSKLSLGIDNVPDPVMEAFKNLDPTSYSSKVEYFKQNVVPLISENERETVAKALCLLIKDDDSIGRNTEVNLVSRTLKKDLNYQKDDLATLLTGVFFYVLKNTNNRQRSGLAKETANKFIEKARNEIFFEKADELPELKSDCVRLRFLSDGYMTSECIAVLLVHWEDDNRYDRRLIECFSGKKYSDVQEDIRLQNDLSISLEHGFVECVNARLYRLSLISDIDSDFLMVFFDALRSVLSDSSNILGLSKTCINGICDFLAYVGFNVNHFKRIKKEHWRRQLYTFFTDVLSEVNNIQLFSDSFSLLVEADPDLFLSSVEKELADSSGVLFDLIKRKNDRVVWSVADALRKVAAWEEYFSRAMSLLFDLAQYDKSFLDTMTYILNPGLPQTETPIDIKIGVIKSFFAKDNDLAWRCLVELLPGNDRTTIKCQHFSYWPMNFTSIVPDRYNMESKKYLELACEKMLGTTEQIKDLLSIYPILSDESSEIVVNAISNNASHMNAIPDYERVLSDCVSENFRYGERKKELTVQLRQIFTQRQKELPSLSAFNFPLEKKRSKKTVSLAKKTIREIYKESGSEGIVKGLNTVDDIWFYAETISQVLSEKAMKEIFIFCMDEHKIRELRILVSGISSDLLLRIVSVDDPKFIRILCLHKCDDYIMNYINTASEELQDLYWTNVEDVDVTAFASLEFEEVAKCLLRHKNFLVLFRGLYLRLESESMDCNLLIDALEQYDLRDEEVVDICSPINHHIRAIISYLRQHCSNIDKISDIEAKYICCLVWGDHSSAKCIYAKMAVSPEYVEKLLLYRKNSYDEMASVSTDLLFREFHIAPGTLSDNSFDYSVFYNWYLYANNCPDPEIREEMLDIFGRAIFYSPADDGFFMNRKVADFLQNVSDQRMMAMFEMELFDSIGSIKIDPKLKIPEGLVNDCLNKARMCEREGYIQVAWAYRNVSDVLKRFFEQQGAVFP